MAFDGIITKSVLYELNTCLQAGKINKVFEPNKNEILLGIYAGGKNYALTICIDATNCRMHLTTNSKPNPFHAPNFCMLLRKHLIGMRIKAITMLDLERIVTIELEGLNELNDPITKQLVIELMGKHSNIILLNENQRIIDSMRHFDITSNATRTVSPASQYVLPPSSKKSFLRVSSFEDFYQEITSNLPLPTLDSIITNTYIGISKMTIHSVLAKLSLSNTDTSVDALKRIYTTLKDLINNIDTNHVSCIPFLDSERKKEDYVLALKEKETPLSINFFLDDFYSQKETTEEFNSYRNAMLKLILKELQKYTKRLTNIAQKLDECSKMDTYRLYGELITANLYRIKDENTSSITLDNYYENNLPITISLDKTISPSYNAKKFFKKYAKLKSALEIVSVQKQDTAQEIKYLESIVYELERAKTISEVDSIYQEISEHVIFKEKLSTKKNAKKEKTKKKKETDIGTPIETIVDNFPIYIGKNNKQNDYLTLKFAYSKDLWFHTKDVHGSHVILKTDGKEVPQEVINRVASIAAFYSKATQSSNVPVDYTLVRYVKKPSGAKPGMVIYTNQQTVYVNPQQI